MKISAVLQASLIPLFDWGGGQVNIYSFSALKLYDIAFQSIRNAASLCEYHAFQTVQQHVCCINPKIFYMEYT